MSGRGTDFFISHAGRDTAWAGWLAWQHPVPTGDATADRPDLPF